MNAYAQPVITTKIRFASTVSKLTLSRTQLNHSVHCTRNICSFIINFGLELWHPTKIKFILKATSIGMINIFPS